RNPKPETRNPKPETRNPKPETLTPKPENVDPKSHTRNPKPENRSDSPSITDIAQQRMNTALLELPYVRAQVRAFQYPSPVSDLRVRVFRFRVSGFGFRVSVGVWGLGFRGSWSWFRVSDFGFRISGFGRV
ncbi:hypothetical protein T484DRAFT_1642356, partial [Baffinella frigidus]